MKRIRSACAGISAVLALAGCLERHYDNPFLVDSGSESDAAWKRDNDGDGIADSVEAYAKGCTEGPAACLDKARRNAKAVADQAGKIGKDSLPPTGADSIPGTPGKPDSVPVPPNKPDSMPVPTHKPDSVPVPVPPKDTVRDTVIVVPPTVAVTGIQAVDVFIPMGAAKARPAVSVVPRDAKNQGYSLQSLDESVAKVSGTELVPVKAGTARIRAISDEGGFTAEFQATVLVQDTNRYEESISAGPMELVAGDPAQAPTLTWVPADVTRRDYSLVSSDPAKVLVVMESGVAKCKPLAAGWADLTVKTLGKGLTTVFRVTVKPAPLLTLPVLAIGAENMTFDLGGPDQAPKISYTPANPTHKGYTLSSDKPGIVSVAGTNLHAVAGGTARITLISEDGPFGIFQVTVRVRVQALSAPDLTLAPGDSQEVAVQFQPANADNQEFSLSSSQPKNVDVVGHAVVARKKGGATITVTAADGAKTATFQVQVAAGKGPG